MEEIEFNDKKIEAEMGKLITNMNYCRLSLIGVINKDSLKTKNSYILFKDKFSELLIKNNDFLIMIGEPDKEVAKILNNVNKTYIEAITNEKDNNRDLSEKDRKILEKYYLFYSDNGESKGINKLMVTFDKLKDYIKVLSIEQQTKIKTHQDEWDRVLLYLNSSNIINKTVNYISSTEESREVADFLTQENIIDKIKENKDDIKNLVGTTKLKKEKNIENKLYEAFDIINNIEKAVDGIIELDEETIEDDEKKQKEQEKIENNNTNIQLTYENKNNEYETKLGQISKDLAKLIEEAINILNETT